MSGQTEKIETVAEKERRLVIAAQAGDMNAMAELVYMHKAYVWFLARRMRAADVSVEDLAQVGLIALMRGVRSFDVSHGVRLLTYCTRVIQTDLTREAQRWRKRRLAALPSEDMRESGDCPAEEFQRLEDVATVRKVLRKLSPRLRSIVTHRMAGQSLEEIGNVHSISKERVRQLEGKAHNRIAELLGVER